MKNFTLKLFFLTVFLFVTCSYVFAYEPKEFISMPDEINSKILQNIYESSRFSVNKFSDGLYQKNEFIKSDDLSAKNVWQGSPIRKLKSTIQDFTLYFKPNKFRKFGDFILEDFKLHFKEDRITYIVTRNDSYKDVLTFQGNNRFWLKSNNKSDVVIFVPQQETRFDTRTFMICPRANPETKLAKEINLVDTGYVIDKINVNFTGGTEATFSTGSIYKGRIDLKILNTDIVSSPEIPYDLSDGKDPKTSLEYVPTDNKVAQIHDDENIVAGLKFLYDMRYESGKRRVSDFTNYFWIKKNNVDLPLSFMVYKNNQKYLVNINPGACYNVILNVKVFNNAYMTQTKEVNNRLE